MRLKNEEHAFDMLGKVKKLMVTLEDLMEEAKDKKHHQKLLATSKELRNTYELIAKMLFAAEQQKQAEQEQQNDTTSLWGENGPPVPSPEELMEILTEDEFNAIRKLGIWQLQHVRGVAYKQPKPKTVRVGIGKPFPHVPPEPPKEEPTPKRSKWDNVPTSVEIPSTRTKFSKYRR